MDVPFISSGAQSRAHYALVRKVEGASSPQQADQYLFAEVNSIHARLSQPGLSLKSCKECLVILLYCNIAMTSSRLAHGELDFALPQAVNLAEAGATTSDKRIGYLFCTEVMPQQHELQLMLVNTLRKDLENPSIPRISLALDILIHSASEDVIPAVQSRLHELISHNSPHIRRRALLAFRALARYDPEPLKRVASKVQKRLRDTEPSVVGAALIVCADVARLSVPQDIAKSVNLFLRTAWETRPERSKTWALLKATRAVLALKPFEDNLPLILQIIHYASNPLIAPLVYGTFRLLSQFPSEAIAAQQTSHGGAVQNIRHLLSSSDPNEKYAFMACLRCVDPGLWAGTDPARPAVLDGWEVEKVMKLLDSEDRLLRKNTLFILYRVDQGIVDSYYAQSTQGVPSMLSVKAKNEYAIRLLEVAEVLCGGKDGLMYAQKLGEIFGAVERDAVPERQPVLEQALEKVLLFIKQSSTFGIGCATALIGPITEASSSFSSTLMVIISAMASEFTGQLPLTPVDILRGLASRLSSYPAPIQEACLLSMLRVAADCDEVPSEVLILVKELGQSSGKHIRNRCHQFVTLSGQRNLLGEVVSRALSPSLPDFLDSLVTQTSPQSQKTSLPPTSPTRSPTRSTSGSQASPSLAASKLRYAAYEPPHATPRLGRRPASSQRSYSGSSRSGEGRPSLDEMSRTVTAGDLALATGDIELDLMTKKQQGHGQPVNLKAPVEDQASRADLMTFDSPFISDPPDSSLTLSEVAPDFKGTWNAQEGYNSRGWCDVSIDLLVRRLQGLQHRLQVTAVELPPFEGDLKVLISSGSRLAALRLKESDEESCLWRLRCQDDELRASIRTVLNDA